ncbi:hypothetical protein Hanom_Chr16g01465461 [Helianthus anomalus]
MKMQWRCGGYIGLDVRKENVIRVRVLVDRLGLWACLIQYRMGFMGLGPKGSLKGIFLKNKLSFYYVRLVLNYHFSLNSFFYVAF